MCGVIGVLETKDVTSDLDSAGHAAYDCYRGLLTLQHRGQDAAGITTYDESENRFHQYKDLGLINQVFSAQDKIFNLRGSMAIGHTRYATTGSDDKANLQPMITGYPFGISMAHNGNLANYHLLKKELEQQGLQLLSSSDLELIVLLWSLEMQKHKQLNGSGEHFENFDMDVISTMAKNVMMKLDGGYACVGMIPKVGMVAFRDPAGIRPLVIGVRENENGRKDYCFASETIALNFLGFEYLRDVRPGEIILASREHGLEGQMVYGQEKKGRCMFEWVYFSAAESSFEDKSIYSARLELGRKLGARVREKLGQSIADIDVICPVPDTSRSASIALAEELNIPYREGLIKNRYVQRSFILNTQEAREKAVELKLSPVRSEVEGKNILLVDDSIVRGTTSKQIIKLLKKFGAKKVILAITSPPLRHGCFYGIDFPNEQELIAHGRKEHSIAEQVVASDVIYLKPEDLQECIGISDLCMGCVTNEYPTKLSGASEFKRRRNEYR